MMTMIEAIKVLRREQSYAKFCANKEAVEAYDVAFKAFEYQKTLVHIGIQVFEALAALDRDSLTLYEFGKYDAYRQVLEAIEEGDEEE